MAESERPLTKRTVLVALILLAILLGAGIGVIDQSNVTLLADEETTPAGPTVTVTPPQTETPTETPTSTAETGPGGESTATESETEAGVDGSVSVDASDPSDVSNGAGHVTLLEGEVSGTAEWEGSADRAVVVVSSFSPEDGWSEVRRTTVETTDGSLTLEDALDSPETRYLAGERTEPYNNPHDGTTLTRTSYVGVTVVLFEDGEERGRLTDTTEYSFDVTNEGSPNMAIDAGEVKLRTGSVSGTASDGVKPGATGNQSTTVENAGDASGTLRVFLTNVTGSENGFAEPEAEVDDDQASELLAQLGVRISVVSDTDRTYLLGGPDEYVSLTRPVLGDRSGEIGSVPLPAGESRAVVVEWSIPESAGNEIMTDTAEWDLEFVLENDDSNG